jgi:hypothetical protein
VRNSFAATVFLGWALASLTACGGVGVKPDEVPVSLRTPQGQLLVQRLHAIGAQIYTCQPAKTDPSRFEWTLKAPDAELFAKAHQKVGRHFAGPSWEGSDGSKVVGSLVAKETPDSSAIPWLLLNAKSTSGSGIFTDVRSIQRLHTVGGNAPADGCSPAQLGQEVRVSYSADYLFYR